MEQILEGITPSFTFEEVETKGEKEYYVSGYISTDKLDRSNEIVTDECMDDMVAQCKSGTITLDFEHESIHSQNLDINPFGRIVEAKRDKKGVWIKAILNSSNKRFNEIWGSIKGGFLHAFSIAFRPIEAVTKSIAGRSVKILNKIRLFNVGLTGTPINDECSMDNVFTKAITQLEEENEEVEKKGGPGSGPQKGQGKKMREEGYSTSEITQETGYDESAEEGAIDYAAEGFSEEEISKKLQKDYNLSKKEADTLAKDAMKPEKTKTKALTTTSGGLTGHNHPEDPQSQPNESHSTDSKPIVKTESDDNKNKMAEEETTTQETVEAEAETTEEAKPEVKEVKTEDTPSEIEAEVKAIKAENKSILEKLAKLEKQLEEPNLKATQTAPPQLNETNNVTALDLI